MKRFWNKVRHGQVNECWEWQAGTTSDGYGLFWFNGKYILAHRFAWMLANAAWGNVLGTIPKHLCVLHTCDNPRCVNDNHLILGTIKDNNRDRDQKGRRGTCGQKSGEEHTESKLTKLDVRTIRMLYVKGFSQKEIANKYHITQSAVSLIIRYRRWSDVYE